MVVFELELLKSGWGNQSVDEGQFVNYFCPLVFVKGLQFAIIWTEECLTDEEKQFLYKINRLKDII